VSLLITIYLTCWKWVDGIEGAWARGKLAHSQNQTSQGEVAMANCLFERKRVPVRVFAQKGNYVSFTRF